MGKLVCGLAIYGAVALGLASEALAQGTKDVRVVFVTHGQAVDPYWSTVKRGVDDAAKMTGIRAEYNAPDTFDPIQMAQLIDAAVASKPDGLVISFPDADALGPPLTRALKAGIPVITIDAGEEAAKRLGVTLHVGSAPSYEAGRVAGEQLVKAGALQAICVNQEVGNVSLDDRCRGITDVLKQKGGATQVVAVTMDPTDITSRVGAYLSAHPEVQGVVTMGATSVADPLIDLFRQRGLSGKHRIYTFDTSAKSLESIMKGGEVGFDLDGQQYLQGFLPVVLLRERALYGFWPTTESIWIGPKVIDTPQEAAKTLELSKLGIR